MHIEKINWKAFVASSPKVLSSDTLFRIFNDWIPDSEEIFIDVADYDHCYGGVKVILAGHYTHYYWDETDGQLGLMYSRVRPFELNGEADGNDSKNTDESSKKKIKDSLISFLKRLEQFRQDPRLEGEVIFDPKRLRFSINDRALAPNTLDTFQQVAPLIKSELSALGGRVELEHLSESRRLFSIDISLQKALFT